MFRQLKAALAHRDPERMLAVTISLKENHFKRYQEQFGWEKYPKLYTPSIWTSFSWALWGRDKIEQSFYVHTTDPIHHSLTEINDSALQKKAINMFKAVVINQVLSLFFVLKMLLKGHVYFPFCS